MKRLSSIEIHPYGMFLPPKAKSIIIGSFPIAKFTSNRNKLVLKENEIDFSYGGERNHLWSLLSICFNEDLKSKNQIINFLEKKGIAMGDVIHSCRRIGTSSNDNDLRDVKYCPSLFSAISSSSIKTILFTSVRVEELFHRKIGRVKDITEILLISPSGNGIRKIPNRYKKELEAWKILNPGKKLQEFRIYKYKKIFTESSFPDLYADRF